MLKANSPQSDEMEVTTSDGDDKDQTQLDRYRYLLIWASSMVLCFHIAIIFALFIMIYVDEKAIPQETMVLCFLGSIAVTIWASVGTYEIFEGISTMKIKNEDLGKQYDWHQTQYMTAVGVAFALVFFLVPPVSIYICSLLNQKDDIIYRGFFTFLFDELRNFEGNENKRNTFKLLLIHFILGVLLLIVSFVNVFMSTHQLRKWQKDGATRDDDDVDNDEDSSDDEGEEESVLLPAVKISHGVKYLVELVVVCYFIYLLVVVTEPNSFVEHNRGEPSSRPNSGLIVYSGIEIIFFLVFSHKIIKYWRKQLKGDALEYWENSWRLWSSMHVYFIYMVMWAVLVIIILWHHEQYNLLSDFTTPILWIILFLYFGLIISYFWVLVMHQKSLTLIDNMINKERTHVRTTITPSGRMQIDPSRSSSRITSRSNYNSKFSEQQLDKMPSLNLKTRSDLTSSSNSINLESL